MAQRRLISRSVIYSDVFFSLTTRQLKLYIYMILEADDDGFVGSVNQILLFSGSTRGDLDELIRVGVIIQFKSGVCVIVHWRLHNEINRPGYKKTNYIAELSQVYVDDDMLYAIQ